MQQAKVENLQRLYEIDDNPDRKSWLDKLLNFMEERGTPITQCPTISKNPLDLYKLYIYTKDRGGFLEVYNVTYNFALAVIYLVTAFLGGLFLIKSEGFENH